MAYIVGIYDLIIFFIFFKLFIPTSFLIYIQVLCLVFGCEIFFTWYDTISFNCFCMHFIFSLNILCAFQVYDNSITSKKLFKQLINNQIRSKLSDFGVILIFKKFVFLYLISLSHCFSSLSPKREIS